MKTTIDIPDALYKKAKIRALETGQTLKQILLTSLEKGLAPRSLAADEPLSYWANRKLHPGFKRLMEPGALEGESDSTQIISGDRSWREDSLHSATSGYRSWTGRLRKNPVEKFARISTGAVIGHPIVEVLTNFATRAKLENLAQSSMF